MVKANPASAAIFSGATTLALAVLLPALAHAAAGSVQFVSGDARIVPASGLERLVEKGAELNEGDTVITGRGASVQLRMVDEGLIALRPETQMKIDTYRYDGVEDGKERGVLGLLRGGFRALTGIIGRTNKQNYLINTPTATIGIRGTDHEVVHIPVPTDGQPPIGAPGTYNKVNVGETFVQTSGGRIELSANQIGFASSVPGIGPVKLDTVPGFLRATPQQQGRDERRQTARESSQGDQRRIAQEQPQQQNRQEQGNRTSTAGNPGSRTGADDSRSPDSSGSSRSSDSSRSSGLSTSTGFAEFSGNNGRFGTTSSRTELPRQTTNSSTTFTGTGSVLTSAPAYYSGAGGDLSNGLLGSGAVINSNGTSVLFDVSGNLSDISSTDGFRYSRAGAPFAENGSTVLNKGGASVPINWGIYAGGSIIDQRDNRQPTFFYFMSGQGTTPAAVIANLTGTLTYGGSAAAPFAQTKLITETGNLGGNVNNARITITSGQLSAYSIGVRDALNRNWAAAYNGAAVSLNQFASNGISLDVTTAPGTGASGKASGIPVGPSAQAFISSFNLKTAAGQGVAGAFTVK